MIQLRNDANVVVGVDLGTTAIRGVLADLSAGILAEVENYTPVEAGFDEVMESVAKVVDRLLRTEPAKKKRIHGLGMAVAGLINSKSKIVEFSPDFQWENVDISRALKGRFGFPVFYDNVTRVMAVGEMCYGKGSVYRDFVCVNVGHGIGAGVITNGRPFGGAEGLAGEFGHITLDKDSPFQCQCGNYGCLEALASGQGIARAARRALESGRESSLRSDCGGDLSLITAKMVSQAVDRGDDMAREILVGAAEYVGVGIAALVNLFNPQAVFLGGGVVQGSKLFFNTIKETVPKRVMPRRAHAVDILPVTHGLNAAVTGAISLVLDKVVKLELGQHALSHATN